MADRLSRIIGTEEDKVNCPFYYKIGACRHGDRCSRTHLRPTFSQTLLMPHLYQPPPPGADGQPVDDTEHFEEFFEEILEELAKFGEVEQLNVVENLGDHMFGNVYVKFHSEENAEKCAQAMAGRYYAGRMVAPEYSPVTDFSEARCRQFDESQCARGGYCNFMHLKQIPRYLRRLLRNTKKRKKSKRRRRSRSRSPRSRRRRSSKSRSRSRSKTREKVDLSRSDSAERRAKIASWNKAADKVKEPEPAGDVPPADKKEESKEAPAPAAEAPAS
jgi:splicing factor U2AF subunit